MNLLEWRQNPERRSLALDMLNQQTLREMLAVMELEHPGRVIMPLRDGFDATLAMGEARGFQMALNAFRSFAEPIPSAPASLPVTWGANEPETKAK